MIENSAYITAVGSASSKTQSFTVGSGTNRYLLVGTIGTTGGSDIITGVTYNGVAMTKVGSSIKATGDRWTALWYLQNPSSGANDIVISASGSDWIEGSVVSLQDIVQQAPEASNSGTANSSTSQSIAVTPVSNYAYVLAFVKVGSNDGSAGSNTSYVNGSGSNGAWNDVFLQRTDNPITTTSSTSIAWTTSTLTSHASIIVSLKAVDNREPAGGIIII